MTSGYNWSRHLISNSGADGEQQLVAALLTGAREACANGNQDDCRWLRSCGLAYLTMICPHGVDEATLLNALLLGLPDPDADGGWRESAQDFVQLILTFPIEGSDGDRGGVPALRSCAPARSEGGAERHLA